jgi:hypothetical protein
MASYRCIGDINSSRLLPQSRKVIFWRNDADNLTTGPDDIVQYWGAQSQTANGKYLQLFSDWKKHIQINLISLRLLVS